MSGYVFGGHIVHVAEEQGSALARGEDCEAGFEDQTSLFAQQIGFGTGGMARMEALGQLIEISEVDAAVPAEMVERGVGGDAGEPMGGFVQILQLIFTGERLDEGVLGEVLRVGDVADDAVDEQEDALHVELHELIVQFAGGPGGGVETRFGLLHAQSG